MLIIEEAQRLTGHHNAALKIPLIGPSMWGYGLAAFSCGVGSVVFKSERRFARVEAQFWSWDRISVGQSQIFGNQTVPPAGLSGCAGETRIPEKLSILPKRFSKQSIFASGQAHSLHNIVDIN